jgi:hypothetical protein
VTTSGKPTPESKFLSKFASVVGLLATALFFTGWIYRWSYFYCFQLNVITLDLPADSFFIVPLQVFLGDGWTLLKSTIALLLTALAIYLTLWLVHSINNTVAAKIDRIIITRSNSSSSGKKFRWIYRILNSWEQFNVNQYNSIEFLRSLVDEIIIVGWLLLVLFWSAYHQGIADARRDAGENSTLPVITLIANQDNIPLGRKLDDTTLRVNPKEFKAIGDLGLFEDLSKRDYSDINNPKEPRVWRLLLARGNWIYLFPALTKKQQKDPKARPPVVAVQQSLPGRLLIVSPAPSQPSK